MAMGKKPRRYDGSEAATDDRRRREGPLGDMQQLRMES